jgi:hypothetical protein
MYVKVRSLAGNFDTLGKNVSGDSGVQNQNFDFWHLIDPDFKHTVDFFARGPQEKH